MKTWFKGLSKKQRVWLFSTITLMLMIVIIGILFEPKKEQSSKHLNINIEMSIKDIAPGLGVTGKSLARELELPLNISKKKPLKSLEISQEQLKHSVEHILSHHNGMIKYYIYLALVLGGVIFLLKVGRSNSGNIQDRKSWYPRAPYIFSLIISIIFAGFLLGKSPNPMEGAVKTFKCIVGLYPDPWMKLTAFIFFMLLALIGNKVICGWACPFGAIQELIYSIPILKNIKRKKIPFIISNSIRLLLFFIMLIFLFGIIGGKQGFVIYHNLNPFNLFDWEFESIGIILTIIITLTLAFFSYRPFCTFICPFGLISWVAERFSIFCVKVDLEKCTKCDLCIKACPTEHTKALVNNNKIIADCFSCGRCLNKCPVDAIKYKFRFKLKK